MNRVDAWRMVQRRATDLGTRVRIGCHTFRATGITAYLEAGGTLENAQAMAAHESPRTTKLYDRTGDESLSMRSSGSRFDLEMVAMRSKPAAIDIRPPVRSQRRSE
jgi:site-specific recombinase XerD